MITTRRSKFGGPSAEQFESMAGEINLKKQILHGLRDVSNQLGNTHNDSNELIDVMKLFLLADSSLKENLTKREKDALNYYYEATMELAKLKFKAQAAQSTVWLILFVLLGYSGLLLTVWINFNKDSSITFFDIPIAVIVWGCIGGLTSIMFRYQSIMDKKWPLQYRRLWIMTRPLLGAVMGSFTFIAIVSGLLVFGNTPQADINRQQLLWGLSFVAGVSDRFWEILINSIVTRYSGQNEKE